MSLFDSSKKRGFTSAMKSLRNRWLLIRKRLVSERVQVRVFHQLHACERLVQENATPKKGV